MRNDGWRRDGWSERRGRSVVEMLPHLKKNWIGRFNRAASITFKFNPL